ncbi:MAG: GEVED domain-containing protein, partial [Bacteroidetes bacterium]|nr:GEVED domain-containing protein [Bacteroidota bacterium]
KTETFNFTRLAANRNKVLVRFILKDGGNPGPNSNKGWYIDNINITGLVSPDLPPVIAPLITPTGFMTGTGPFPGTFEVKAIVRDFEGVNDVRLIYKKNSSPPDTLQMTALPGDTFQAWIPSVNTTTYVKYWILATDLSPAQLQARWPTTGEKEFLTMYAATFPFSDSFDDHNLWTSYEYGSSAWELGTPAYGNTDSAHSPPNAWDINLSTAYEPNSYCILESPRFHSNLNNNPRVSFWLNYNTEAGSDGISLEYSLNDSSWQPLGVINDPNGLNWFNSSISSIIPRQGWSGQSNGWKKSSFYLNSLVTSPTDIRFRFVFTSGSALSLDGFSIDDFVLQNPGNNEIAVDSVFKPVSGCNLSGWADVLVFLKNLSSGTIAASFPISYQFDSQTPVIEQFTCTIPAGAMAGYNFTQHAFFVPGNDYKLHIKINPQNDPEPLDDTLTAVISSILVPPPLVSNALVPLGNYTVLHAQSALPVRWYDQAVNGQYLGQGNTLITPCLTSQTVFYCETELSAGCISERAADTVFIGPVQNLDAGLMNLLLPVDTNSLSDAEVISLYIINFGSQPFQSASMHYQINGGAIVTEPFNLPTNSGDIYVFSFSQTADLEAIGPYLIKIWIDLAGDTYAINDTLVKTVHNNIFVYQPSGALHTNFADIGKMILGSFSNGFISTTTNNPFAIQTYTDFTHSCGPVSLSRGLTYPVNVIPIFSSYATNCCVKIYIDWNSDGLLDPVGEMVFEAGPGMTNLTGHIIIPLNAHPRYTLMRVVLNETDYMVNVSPYGFYPYGETEDYLVYVYPGFPQDVAVDEILSPSDTTLVGSLIHPRVKIRNKGSIPLFRVPLAYRINQSPNNNYNWDGYLAPDSTVFANWVSTVNMPSGYIFCAFPLLPGDHDGSNDTLCKSITVGINNPIPAKPLLTISPNPCNQILNLDIHLPDNLLFEVKLQNLLGQTIRPVSSGNQTGNQRININTSTPRLVKKINVIH